MQETRFLLNHLWRRENILCCAFLDVLVQRLNLGYNNHVYRRNHAVIDVMFFTSLSPESLQLKPDMFTALQFLPKGLCCESDNRFTTFSPFFHCLFVKASHYCLLSNVEAQSVRGIIPKYNCFYLSHSCYFLVSSLDEVVKYTYKLIHPTSGGFIKIINCYKKHQSNW